MMIARCRKSWLLRPALTLVETLAGTVVLGTLLVTLVVAGARLHAQLAHGQERIQACAIADSLLGGWWADKASFPRNSEGEVPGQPGWRWRTERLNVSADAALKCEIIALSIVAPGGSGQSPSARVEILVPTYE